MTQSTATSSGSNKLLRRGLYLITPDWDDTATLLSVTQPALRGGAVMLQYRNKTATPALAREHAGALLALCRFCRVPMIVNDNVALALEIGADGVHVGGSDASVAEARKAMGPDKIVGASCYGSLDLARAATAAGASYLAFGGFYPSQVKQYDVGTPPEIVAQARAEFGLPVVVIGGMTPENAAPLVAQGADMVAAISSVYVTPSSEAAAKEFAALWKERQA